MPMSMFDFMEQRYKEIEDRAQNIDLLKALAAENLTKIKNIAQKMAKANPSDPFCYNRVFSHLASGRHRMSDYNVAFQKETRHLPKGMTFSDKKTTTFTALTPVKMAQP